MGTSWVGALLRRLAVASALFAAGCSTILAVSDQQRRAGEMAIVGGTVDVEGGARGPLVVGLLGRNESGFYLVDHFVAEKPGPWVFAVTPGTYWVAAFADQDANRIYDGEPALRPDATPPIVLGTGERRVDLTLRIPLRGRFDVSRFSLQELQARTPTEQQSRSIYALSVAGEVTTLDDPRFAPEVASSGMWKFYDFLLETKPGIYFLEPYDPKKIPVLFVHGIGGTPRDFRSLIAALDHDHFQPWVFYYPSGARLEAISAFLVQLFVRARHENDVTRAAVVAHSMGGLVAREFVLQDHERNATDVVRTFVTISSPLGGMAMAGRGIRESPVVINSWHGLAPGSVFLDGLFYEDPLRKSRRRRLPGSVAYHLLFGFQGGDRSGSSDGVVAVSSELRPEAQDEARSLRGFDEDHTSILRSAEVAAYLNGILAALR
jgi:pimeloyl-ACP methyl ester carboxylesterase